MLLSLAGALGTQLYGPGGLTDLGKSVRTVLFVEATGIRVCKNVSVPDWRSTLPRFISSHFSQFDDVRVLVWEADRDFCRICDREGLIVEKHETPSDAFNCREYFVSNGLEGPEVVVVVGTGSADTMQNMKTQPWVGKHTKFIHIPVSRDDTVLNYSREHFDVVVQDKAWVKPVHVDDYLKFRQQCHQVERQNILIYNGRYHEWKVSLLQ